MRRFSTTHFVPCPVRDKAWGSLKLAGGFGTKRVPIQQRYRTATLRKLLVGAPYRCEGRKQQWRYPLFVCQGRVSLLPMVITLIIGSAWGARHLQGVLSHFLVNGRLEPTVWLQLLFDMLSGTDGCQYSPTSPARQRSLRFFLLCAISRAKCWHFFCKPRARNRKLVFFFPPGTFLVTIDVRVCLDKTFHRRKVACIFLAQNFSWVKSCVHNLSPAKSCMHLFLRQNFLPLKSCVGFSGECALDFVFFLPRKRWGAVSRHISLSTPGPGVRRSEII